MNYEPISLLYNLDEIIKKLTHKRFMAFLNNRKVLYKKQFGFQKNFSTAHAITTLIENIEKAVDNKLFVCEISIDLKKVFDILEHNILLQKLHHF